MAYDHDSYVEQHRRTWNSFVKASIWGAGAVAVALILMAIFLV